MSRLQVRTNAFERALALVAPSLANRRLVERLKFTALTGGYVGGRQRRRATLGWGLGNGSADADIIPDLPTLRERSRNLVRNTPLATAASGRVVTNVVGPGLMAQPEIDRDALGIDDEAADAWERQAERVWRLWSESKNCDASRTQSFMALQDLALRSTLESGDCFVVKRQMERPGSPISLALQFYEADQVSTPRGAGRDAGQDPPKNKIIGGIELSKSGEPVAYHIASDHPGNLAGRAVTKWTRVPARGSRTDRQQVLHLFTKRRIGQTRGVPMLAPVIESLKQLGTYSEAELMAAVIGAMITVVYKNKGGEPLPDVQPFADAGTRATEQDYKMASGTVLEIEHGDEVSVPQLGRPNSGFDPFWTAIVRQIGAALEIPFEVLVMHFTASYSASRAALEMAWQWFSTTRTWLVQGFCKPCYEDVIAQAVARGDLDAPGFLSDPIRRQAWLGVRWVGPRRLSIDPKKEAEAAGIEEDRGWKTKAENTAERTGGDWERKHKQSAKEKRMRVADGLDPPVTSPVSASASDDGASQDRPEDETSEGT